ncbi:MAG: hypothetical protein JNL28_00165 [Planctomycetes bacterium]|nr:hypothetical protein [Planctomycetota bacterium]
MNPVDLVRALCARHGLPPEAGAPYLDLVTKALAAEVEVRDRILKLVDAGLAERAAARALPKPGALSTAEREVLCAVARVLHTWTPTGSIIDLGSTLGHLGQEGEAA